jgi:RNA polymerase sigma-70 factor (ECF subfamily)
MVELIPRLRRFAYALAGSKDEGDDLVQAACERALGRLDQFEPGSRLDSWMFRIVQTIWLDRGRRRRTRGAEIDPELVALSDHGAGARRAEDRLTLAAVRDAVAALPEDQRSVIALVAIDGRSYREAADVLGVPVGTVMSRLARARAKLAPLFGRVSEGNAA